MVGIFKFALMSPTTGSTPYDGQPGRLPRRVYPQKFSDLVAKNYNLWLQVAGRQFREGQDDEANFLPLPKEDGKAEPIFNYSLLDALEKVSLDFSDRINKLEETEQVPEIKALEKEQREEEGALRDRFNRGLLKDTELEFLRNRIGELVMKNRQMEQQREGFSLYDTRDEEGLHEGNTDACYDDYDEDDYDLEEIGSDYQPTHHIEVELNTAPECIEHGTDGCDCPMENRKQVRYTTGHIDEEGPSCEFTFEYDGNGTLVPTDNNIVEKLRMMNVKGEEKKKKKKKKKPKDKIPNGNCCLLCEYEAVYGVKPRQMIKWYDQRELKEVQRRVEIKRKLENAKNRLRRRQSPPEEPPAEQA